MNRSRSDAATTPGAVKSRWIQSAESARSFLLSMEVRVELPESGEEPPPDEEPVAPPPPRLGKRIDQYL